ncbi:gephyrin-like [Nylanderia fulva]|uniref:gephyrin-like n=1 Tax=Nylanderia fulva TaxID=613905 RepID=UPI0010FB0FE7|nr:gephyrin-like [Nylanderia fulva]
MFGQCLNASICLQTIGIKESIFKIFSSIRTAQKEREKDATNNNKSPCDTPMNSLIKIKHIIDVYKKTSHALISTLEAEKIIHKTVIQNNDIIEFECVSVHNAYGRILFEYIYSKYNVPSFRTSAKHGYAIKANDGTNIKNVLEEGTSSIEPGTCVLIKPKASIPDGATAVVQLEYTEKIIKECRNSNIDDIEEEIKIRIQPKEGENIRPIGFEIKKGERILEKYSRIGPAEIGLLSYCGITEVIVIKQKLVGILSIGDELEEPGEILGLNYNYDSSGLILITLLKQQDFDILDFGITNDNVESIISKIETALEKVDVLVIIGSANDRDLLKPVLQGYFNATIHFGGVNMSPGKSTTYATCTFKDTKKYFLCFSRNPTIVPIVTHLFLLPLLNNLRCFEKSSPLVQARVQTSPILHSRPKYIWTSLKWNNKDKYARIYDTANYNHNANALLRLPPRTVEESKLPDSYITAVFHGSN